MKKVVLCLALVTLAVSCKKIQAGGNKNIIKMEEGAERYSDDHQGGAESHGHDAAPTHEEATPDVHHTEASKSDSAVAKHGESVKHEEPTKEKEAH